MTAYKIKFGHTLTLIIVLSFLSFQKSLGQDLFFEKIRDPQVAIDTRIIGISKDSLGFMWFGTWNGLYRYDGEHFKTYKYPFDKGWPISNNRLRNLITDEDHQIWILTSDSRYIKYLIAQDSFYMVNQEDVSESVKNLLASTPNELNENRQINHVRYFIESNYFCSINDRTNEKTVYYPDIFQPGQLRDEYISAFYIDDQDIVWIGTRNGKIYKAITNRNPFRLHAIYKEGNPTPVLTAITSIFKNGRELWLGTEYDGIMVKDEETGKSIEHPVNKGRVKVLQPRVIQKDDNGHIWIGSIDGLYYYSQINNSLEPVINSEIYPYLYRSHVLSISEPIGDIIWAGIYQGLARINTKTLETRIYDYHREFSRRTITDVHVDANHRVWTGTEGYCLFRFQYDAEGTCLDTFRIKDFRQLTGRNLDGDCIYDIYEAGSGKVWIGTTEGLFCIDPGTMKVNLFAETEGLPDLYITAITEDKNGNIWVSHKKGISKIHHTDNSISNYSISDNSGNWVFKEGACFNDTANNTIYFGANEGYVSFNPDQITNNPFFPKLVLSQLYVSGTKVDPNQRINNQVVLDKMLYQTDEIILDYNSQDFGFDLTVLDFQNPLGHTFKYQLQGYHDEWVNTNYAHISLLKIPPGDYTLNAKAISFDRQESNTVSLRIVILSPWYATKLAMMTYGLLLCLAFFLGYRIRRSRQHMKKQILYERLNAEKQQEITRERMEFFTNVSHELRTPLSLIIDPLRQLQKKKIAKEKQSKYIDLISKNVDQLNQLTNQILDFRKAEEKKLFPKYEILDGVGIIYDTVMSFDMIAQKRGINLSFESSDRELVGNFDKGKLREIVQNLVSNALKYTPDNGKVKVTVQLDEPENKMVVSVRDNGIGIKRQALRRIFEPFNSEGSTPFYGNSSGMGLALTKNLVKLLGGNISIDSKPKQGTQVRFALPFEKVDQITKEKPAPADLVQQDKTHENPEPTDTKKPTLLIVEDNADLQVYLKTELEDTYHILSEVNGVDGLSTAVSQIPDLVISDVMMPKMDGNKMCKQLKLNEKTNHIPVILLTAKGTDQDRVAGLETGADVYFSKPFNIDVLKAQISSIIANRIALQKSLSQKKKIVELENEQSTLDKRFLQSTIKVIKENIDVEGFNPEQLAEHLNISQRQLYRKLKAITGSTVQELIIKVRMDKASELLKDWQMNIAEVAYQVGFTEPSNFSRTFRKHFGCSPSNYKEKN